MQIHKASPTSHPIALHHQGKRRQGRPQGRRQGNHRDLGLEHLLLGPTQPHKSQFAQGGAFGEGEPQATGEAHHGLG